MEVLKDNKTLYYKDIRIEDFFDLNFYHPLGYRFAVLFAKLGLTPTMVSVISMIVGVCGAFAIYFGYNILGSILIVFSSVLDSSDGQLARMKGLSTPHGRIIDGICGYIVFVSVYISIFLRYKNYYGGLYYCLLMFIAGFSNIIQNSLYDFYRTSILAVKKNDFSFLSPPSTSGFFSIIYNLYLKLQNIFISKHLFILDFVKRNYNIFYEKYEEFFLRNISKVNLLGDNWKINGLIILSFFGRIDLFFFYVIIFLNFIMIFVLVIQNRSEKEFLKMLKEV